METSSWDDKPLRLAVKGLTKRSFESFGGVKKCEFFLEDRGIKRLANLQHKGVTTLCGVGSSGELGITAEDEVRRMSDASWRTR